MNNFLELKNISKIYKKKKNIIVLNKINFKFQKGKSYSIIGPSGSGKSTLLNLLSLIDYPSNGNIIINNKIINYKNKSANDIIRAKRIGIVYQDKNLLSDFTALENVYLARLSVDTNKTKAVYDAKNILKKMGLMSRLEHYPSELSGGESQRVAISRALINYPEIILADEPTGNLDYKNAKDVFKKLLNLKEKNRIIIFATHNRYFANMADCKIEMIDGNIKITNAKI